MATSRDRLLASTNELFRRFGYNGTSLKDVSRAAEAPIGSLYHHFPGGKVELAEAVLVSSGAAYRDLFEMIADGADGPVAAVWDMFDGAAVVLAETDYIDPCPTGTVAREVANIEDRLRLAADGAFRSWIAAFATRLIDAGLAEPAAEDLATTVVAALEGGFVLARTRRDEDLLRTIGRQMVTLVAASVDAVPTPTPARPAEPAG